MPRDNRHLASAACTVAALTAGACGVAQARGPSPYLPLNLSPELERQVETALILADIPVMTRPIAAATVLDALPAVCPRDPVLCRSLRRYLDRYAAEWGVTQASAAVAATRSAGVAVPNRHGRLSDSEWSADLQGYWQPSDHLIVSAGIVADADEVTPTGSLVSFGFDFAQVDVGYKDHWLSPLTDSAMTIGTQSPTAPSISVSNYRPLTSFGIRYEMFVAQLSRSDRIAYEDGFTSGRPNLAGMHLSFEPAHGWSIGFNRLMQFGGGERGGNSLCDILDAFFRPSSADNIADGNTEEFGNQVGSITSRLLFPAKYPFAISMEYAGEDTSRGRDYLLGNSALSVGIDFPVLPAGLDLRYTFSEWQNSWYVHDIYLDGLTNEGRILGAWGAERRVTGDGVGAQAHSLTIGWRPAWGGRIDATYRRIDNEKYGAADYRTAHEFALRYSYPLDDLIVGVELDAGRDTLGNDFGYLAGFLRYGAIGTGLAAPSAAPVGDGSRRADGAELFIEAGVSVHQVDADLTRETPTVSSDWHAQPHLAVGARRAVSRRSDLGVRLELDRVDGAMLLRARALDYRYRFASGLALGVFAGAARYDLATPAYGIYFGLGLQWRDVMPGYDVGIEASYADKVARDTLLPEDPQGSRPDSFYDIYSVGLTLTRRW